MVVLGVVGGVSLSPDIRWPTTTTTTRPTFSSRVRRSSRAQPGHRVWSPCRPDWEGDFGMVLEVWIGVNISVSEGMGWGYKSMVEDRMASIVKIACI